MDSIKDELKIQLEKVKEMHSMDLQNGYGSIYIPYALERKFPKAKFETKWQYIFPMNKISKDPRSGEQRRQHILDVTLSRNIKKAIEKLNIDKKVHWIFKNKIGKSDRFCLDCARFR